MISAQLPPARKAVGAAKAKYNPSDIAAYLAANHPACPKRIRKRIGQIAAEGRWTGLALDTMTQRCVAHYVVAEVCGVHRLVECGLSAAVANQMIEPQRKAVMKLWGF
ncbi:hypothetical protein [Brevundimonas sp. P7753]|uniref:hypothetical protein n=1 Tax=Brevundimonas sp. P7753 TaxID=2726982 RepID=UPI0015BAF465|nr:hypothetical protein [Brevundimonas sp. P7753]NWE51576.1 hypothetical protein [Brevundimonas sp. P7753]